MRRVLILIPVFLIVTACGETATSTTEPPPPVADSATDSPANDDPVTSTEMVVPTTIPTEATIPTPTAMPPFDGASLSTHRGDYFNGAGNCAACHQGMVDSQGRDVSTDSGWRSSMMANAARDPYWQATVRSEVLENPELAAVIEDKCATCHMPMARTTAVIAGESTGILDDGFLDPDNALHSLAMDAVSCAVCHQIESVEAEQVEMSFSGEYAIDSSLPTGERLTYGPFEPSEQAILVMQIASGFIPAQSDHIRDSELCASCHTLYTPYVDETGTVAGEFPEQTPYLEWLNSTYAETQSCIDCHMPLIDGPVQLTTVHDQPREGARQHLFVGGNNTTLEMLRVGGDLLGVTTSSDHVDATIAAMEEQFMMETASVTIGEAQVADGVLRAVVDISNVVGHKFPTGFPSRRAWLHITVKDSNGAVVFESGTVDELGRIAGNDNDSDASIYEPHYDVIQAADEVQIYETILHDTEGNVTTTLLRAAAYQKDNRLLPTGFDSSAAPADIASQGLVIDDANFAGGMDTVQLAIPLAEAVGPYHIHIELLYQAIGYRWAMEVIADETREAALFGELYELAGNIPVQVAFDSVTVEP